MVTDQVDQSGDYPSFNKVVTFVEREARIACNLVASFPTVKGQPSHQALTANTKPNTPPEAKENKDKKKKKKVCTVRPVKNEWLYNETLL